MTNFNQTLIEKARRGEIAILIDGSVEELRRILNEVFPNDLMTPIFTVTSSKYFLPHPNDNECWMGETSTNLPAHSVKDFFMPDTKDTQQPRTYKVTRQQMKEIWKILPVGADGEEFRNSLQYLFDPFENEAELNEAQVKRIMKDFPEVQPSKLRSIFPEYFLIPEGEPVLVRNTPEEPWVIRIANGKGKAYINGNISGDANNFDYIIPFTKNPPK